MSEAAAPATPAVPNVADLPPDPIPMFGTRAEVQEALGLEPEATELPRGPDGKFLPRTEDAPAVEAKTVEEPASEPDATAEETARQAELRAIMKRSRERREAREKSRRPVTAPAAAPAPAPAVAPPVVAAATSPKPVPPPAGVAAAVSDVLAQIAKLAGEDEAAHTTEPTAAQDAATAARTAEIGALKTQVETLAKLLTTDQEGLKGQVAEMGQRLKAIDDANLVRGYIAKQVDAIAEELPTLGARRDGLDLVHAAAEKFHAKYGVPPNMRVLARRIEAKLSATTDTTSTTTAETPTERAATRKTVSSTSHGSPPAARSGPDARSAAEVEAEFAAKYSINQ